MSSPTDSPGIGFRFSSGLLLVYYGLLFAVALPAVVVSWLVKREYPEIFAKAEYIVGGALFFVGGIIVGFSQDWFFANILFVWLVTLLSFPFVGFMSERFHKFADFFNPKTPQQKLQEGNRQIEKYREKVEAKAEQRKEIAAEKGKIRLGRYLEAGDEVMAPGISITGGWVVLDQEVLNTHMFIVGATGSGKTETMKRKIFEILHNTDMNLIFIDGKGELDLAYDVQKIAYHTGRGVAPIFKLAVGEQGDAYNAFMGGTREIYNRLIEIVGISKAEGNAEFFADVGREIMYLMCMAPVGPPRSFGELLERLQFDWLRKNWKHDPIELDVINNYAENHKREYQGFAIRVRAVSRNFREFISEDGFAFDDTKVAIFSIKAMSAPDDSRRFFNLMMEDLKDFIGQKKRQAKPTVIIIDEFGLFPPEPVIPLLQLARSSGGSIILATQDTTTIGNDEEKQNLLANATTQIMMRTDFPEYLGKMAGTVQQIEASTQLKENEETGMGSARVQDAFKISMNNPPRLKPGQGYLMRHRRAYKFRTDRIPQNLPNIPPEVLAAANQQRRQQAVSRIAREKAVNQEMTESTQPPAVKKHEEKTNTKPTGLGIEDLLE